MLKLLVCIVFFFHYFKYYGQNIFSRTTMLYIIAKVERKEWILYLKHEIILYQKEKKNKIFRVRTISKDIRKTIVPSFMFLFNYFEVCRPLYKENKTYNFHQWPNEIKNKHTWFSRKIFVFYRKWRIKNSFFRCAICLTPWSFLNQTPRAFSAHLLMF